MKPKTECQVCGGDGWICEEHPWQPYDTWHQVNCKDAGIPCTCSNAHPDNWSEEERARADEIERQLDQINRQR